MNVSLGKNWEDYVAQQVASGSFSNASEVVQDALRMQQEHFLKLGTLRHDLSIGVQSIQNGRVSEATANDIKAKALARKATA